MPPMDREYPGGLAGPVGTPAIASRYDPWFLALITGREDFGDLDGETEENVNLYTWERIAKITRADGKYPIVKLEASNDEKGPWLDVKHNRRVGFALNIHEISTDNTGAREDVTVTLDRLLDAESGEAHWDGPEGDPHHHPVQYTVSFSTERMAGAGMWHIGTKTSIVPFLTWLRLSPVPIEIRENLGEEPCYLFEYKTSAFTDMIQTA